ncbi:Cation transporter family protein [Teladorsagia circumcincta]|uniref:Cation transporter family protein n=1 Tax=Teladorsagia circumcincta TaxID=45464 RepID=A0A2G9UF77_TELCI|nr:Cation transporter family protein [Teladorsagia circumcincta]
MKHILTTVSSRLPLFVTSYCLETVEQLLLHRSKRPPTENETHPLEVKLGMYLESLGNFRSSEMSFDADIYVYMSWKDIRLAHNFSDYVLINDDKMRKQIWLPDLYFANARQAHFQEVTVPNFNMFISPDGTVAYSLRCTLTVACNLDLRFYPMDSQMCSIRVLSYAYIAKQVNVTWFDSNPIRSNPEIGLPEFMITAVAKSYCNGTYRYALMPNSYKLDNFSCLEGNLYLSRSIGYNLVQSYIPTGLIVMISWVSFWIDRRAVPARVTLSFTTLVSLTTLGNGLRFGLPQVSYVKAIDLWYGACMLFVFSALLEFAIINSYMRKSEKFDSMGKRIFSSIASGRNHSGAAVPSICSKQLECKDSNGFCEREKDNGNRQPIRFIDDATTASSKQNCRVSNAKALGTSLLKRPSGSENIQCIDNNYASGEDNRRSTIALGEHVSVLSQSRKLSRGPLHDRPDAFLLFMSHSIQMQDPSSSGVALNHLTYRKNNNHLETHCKFSSMFRFPKISSPPPEYQCSYNRMCSSPSQEARLENLDYYYHQSDCEHDIRDLLPIKPLLPRERV